jgi:gamma-glutamylcyclotransferase (GGCT)/AIG2-like uncharacterized protein YtfP
MSVLIDTSAWIENFKVTHLFAYGSLMCEDIMEQVTGCHLIHEQGAIRGYQRWTVKNEDYPALLPREGGHIAGVIYYDVPDSAWERLDGFEGGMYKRQTLQVELKDGTTLQAATYVVKPSFLDLLDATDWDFIDFLTNRKARFQKQYKGYLSL